MEETSPTAAVPPTAKRRRAVKACVSCRRSKVKCDGERPCSRCVAISAECLYFEAPADPVTEFERLEHEIGLLKARLDTPYGLPRAPSPSQGNVFCYRQSYNGASNLFSQAMSGQQTATPQILPPISSLSTHEGLFRTPDGRSASRTGYTPSNIDNLLAPNGSTPYAPDPPPPSLSPRRDSVEESSRKRKRGAFLVQTQALPDLVTRGVVSEEEARLWFRSFFTGSHRLVPVFCTQFDTLPSVRSRSTFMFDAIITVGCRAENGPGSQSYQRLQPLLREHLSNFLLQSTAIVGKSIETVQALLVMASYSDNGWLITSIALRLALELDLPETVDKLVARTVGASIERVVNGVDEEEKRLFRHTRTWYGVLNLDHIFSLDGGKKPAVIPVSSPRRLRVLLIHPQRTPVDLRLFAQVELNAMRSSMLEDLPRITDFSLATEEAELASAIRGARIDLDLWLEEWTSIIQKHSQEIDSDTNVTLLNLQIQHEWALITLHMKAISMMGVENLALMTELQRSIILAAKEAAERHLELLLHASSANEGDFASPASERTYLASFKWTMDFVWAKCAFSVLLVLRLSMLLRDPAERLMQLLHQAHELLEELERGTGGQIAYFQILAVSVEKFQRALTEHIRQQQRQYERGDRVGEAANFTSTPGTMDGEQDNGDAGTLLGNNDAEQDFQAYAPRELLQQWDFPGLNLRYVPIGWQDFFMDFDTMF